MCATNRWVHCRDGRRSRFLASGRCTFLARSRDRAIFLVKSFHTLIFIVESICVFYLLYAAAANRVNRWTAVAVSVITFEGVVLYFNNMQCPLRVWTKRLGASRGSVTDLFLPRWLADRIFEIYTPFFALGCLGVLVRKLRG